MRIGTWNLAGRWGPRHRSVVEAAAPHQVEGLLSIDHVAVPGTWAVDAVRRHRAFVEEARISDHDAYVVEMVR